MPGSEQLTIEELEKLLTSVREADWVREMREYYAQHGTYRPEDLRRVLGDPKQGVEIGARASVAGCFRT